MERDSRYCAKFLQSSRPILQRLDLDVMEWMVRSVRSAAISQTRRRRRLLLLLMLLLLLLLEVLHCRDEHLGPFSVGIVVCRQAGGGDRRGASARRWGPAGGVIRLRCSTHTRSS